MPRIPRFLVLKEGYPTHKMWRGHNKEKNLERAEDKLAYLEFMDKQIKKQSNELNAFALMPNHTHEIYDIKEVKTFCDYMRNHHSQYGQNFNKVHKRQGKVAYERPKTCCIETDEYYMQATFYIHANPLKAGLVKNAANYKYSTHRLYAFGKREDYMKRVKFPQWYMDLGKSWEDRQRKYRQLFDHYLRERGLITIPFSKKGFFGSTLWMLNGENSIRAYFRERYKARFQSQSGSDSQSDKPPGE